MKTLISLFTMKISESPVSLSQISSPTVWKTFLTQSKLSKSKDTPKKSLSSLAEDKLELMEVDDDNVSTIKEKY